MSLEEFAVTCPFCGEDVDIYVGLHNTSTGHYSNGVKAGTVTGDSTITASTITVSDLDKLTVAYHAAAEQAELKYVFY